MSHIPCKKVSFASEKYADFYIDKLKRISQRKKVPVRSYKCDKCNLWHLTSQPHPLEAKVIQLTDEVGKLQVELATLKESDGKEERFSVRADFRVKEVCQQLIRQKEINKQLRKEKEGLIIRIAQLQ